MGVGTLVGFGALLSAPLCDRMSFVRVLWVVFEEGCVIVPYLIL